ncbi:MAG: hypothetical protein LBJ62_03600 [Bifidobacteriaceae bacterium]|jgi:hypothetical protein|nr:hypothetical protein [Bifidobacteriaceae bacterium]
MGKTAQLPAPVYPGIAAGVSFVRPTQVGPAKSIPAAVYWLIVMVVIIAAGTWLVSSLSQANSQTPDPDDFAPAPGLAVPSDTLTVDEFLSTWQNTAAEAIELAPGSWVAGQDFEPGRYLISATEPDQWASLTLSPDDYGPGPISALFELGIFDGEGSTSAVITLPRTVTLNIDSDAPVQLTPAEPAEFDGTLPTGDWVAGVDFEPGRYRLSAGSDYAVSVQVITPPEESVQWFARETRFLEVLCDDPEWCLPEIDITINPGDTIYVDSTWIKLTPSGS